MFCRRLVKRQNKLAKVVLLLIVCLALYWSLNSPTVIVERTKKSEQGFFSRWIAYDTGNFHIDLLETNDTKQANLVNVMENETEILIEDEINFKQTILRDTMPNDTKVLIRETIDSKQTILTSRIRNESNRSLEKIVEPIEGNFTSLLLHSEDTVKTADLILNGNDTADNKRFNMTERETPENTSLISNVEVLAGEKAVILQQSDTKGDIQVGVKPSAKKAAKARHPDTIVPRVKRKGRKLQLVCSNDTTEEQSDGHQRACDRATYTAPDEKEGYEPDMSMPNWEIINKNFPNVTKGGRFTPINAASTQKIAIIVPYRDRRVHLKVFLSYMHAFLQRQNVNYVIYVVEMEQTGLFQGPLLINAGFLEVMKRENVSCFIKHDVDMLPVYDQLVYSCHQSIHHLVAERYPAKVYDSKVRFDLGLRRKSNVNFLGGVVAYPTHLFRAVNGYSNLYSGWGGEDNDMRSRILYKKIPFTKESRPRGRYYTLSHSRQHVFLNRKKLIDTAKSRMDKDGLSSVRYNVEVIEERPLFTWILITTGTPACIYPNFVVQYQNETKPGITIYET